MKMILRKRFRKRIALFLLLVLFVPFVPLVPVSADPLPVQVPDFPYNQDSYYNVNNGGFALWQVHGSNYISYVQTFSSGAVGNPDPIVIFNKTLFYDNYTYYLDVNYITDTWDIYGNHIDGWAGSNTSNIRVPRPLNNPEVPDSDVYATLVYCSDDVRWRNGSDTGIYMFMNYLVPGYADPTPTPIPLPAPLKAWNDYDNTDTFKFVVKCINAPEGSSYKVGHYYGIGGGIVYYPSYANYVNNSRLYDYDYYCLLDKFVYSLSSYCDEVKYDIELNDYSSDGDRNLRVLGTDSTVDGFSLGGFPLRADSIYKTFRSRNYSMNYNTFEGTDWVISNNLENKFGGYIFELVATNHSLTVNSFNNTGSNNIVPPVANTSTPTPTPSVAPTVIPQPSITPGPTDPPDEGDDGNWTGLFGWLKKLVNGILSIPMKIVNGLLNGLKYIFIPDMGKIKTLFSTLNDKFGIQKPLVFEFDPILLKNPENVVMHFKPISLNGEPTEPVDITIIDFDKVDDWLETEQGQIMIRIIQAVFMLTMWGYMIYIFRKHVATINYTDADTLEHSKYWH